MQTNRIEFSVSLVILGGFLWTATVCLGKDSRDDDIFGATSSPTSAPVPKVACAGLDDRLLVGGRLELKQTVVEREGISPAKGETQQLRRADVYFDGRPGNAKDNVRGFLRLRFSDRTVAPAALGKAQGPGQQVTTEVDELWVKTDIHQQFFLTLGRQHVKWGSGRLWNPTDFTASVIRDPFALFDARLGQDLLKIHWPWEKGGHNFYMVIDSSQVSRTDDTRLLLRGELSLGSSSELALSARKSREGPDQIGVDWSGALGPLDIYIESALQKRNPQSFYIGKIDPQTLEVPTLTTKDHKTMRQTVVGFQYGFKYLDDDTVTTVFEYFDNELGYEARDLELYAMVRGGVSPLTVARRYAGVLIQIPGPGSWNDLSLFGSGIRNLSDGTALGQWTATYALSDGFSFQGTMSRCFGDVGSLCFRVPESFKSLVANPQVAQVDRELLQSLPTKRTLTSLSLGVTLEI